MYKKLTEKEKKRPENLEDKQNWFFNWLFIFFFPYVFRRKTIMPEDIPPCLKSDETVLNFEKTLKMWKPKFDGLHIRFCIINFNYIPFGWILSCAKSDFFHTFLFPAGC
jgi:hypothetical protein